MEINDTDLMTYSVIRAQLPDKNLTSNDRVRTFLEYILWTTASVELDPISRVVITFHLSRSSSFATRSGISILLNQSQTLMTYWSIRLINLASSLDREFEIKDALLKPPLKQSSHWFRRRAWIKTPSITPDWDISEFPNSMQKLSTEPSDQPPTFPDARPRYSLPENGDLMNCYHSMEGTEFHVILRAAQFCKLGEFT